MREYTDKYLQNIAYPIGGIGTGNFALAGNGQFLGPDFRAKPNNDHYFGKTCLAIKAEKDGKVVDWRMLNGDNEKDLTGCLYGVYGSGCAIPMLGFKHFKECKFTAKFPFVDISFKDEEFPGLVNLNCYNPFIPSNEKDSSIPTGIFKITISNNTEDSLNYTVAFNLQSLDGNMGKHVLDKKNNLTYFTVFNQYSARSKKNEELIIMTDNEDTGCQHYWYRGRYFDIKTMFMNDFSAPGKIRDRVYDEDGYEDVGVLTASVELNPGESKDINFYFCWYVPHFVPDWEKKKKVLKFSYAKYFKSAEQVANYCYKNRKRLERESRIFSDALFSSDLPEVVINAINRNLCILKSSTCIRLEDGSLWGWEGLEKNVGSCMGTCQHVWNYQYAIPFLFPRLERGMRDGNMRYCLEDNGLLHFRQPITRDYFWWDRAAVDAEMGNVFNCYREWLLSGDTDWLKRQWQNVKKMLEYAWSDKNWQKWDINKSGVMTGMQHNTLDIEIFGVNSWLTGFYHLALVCASKMAKAVGDEEASKEYLEIYERGKKLLDEKTFNGEYYRQDVDVYSLETIRPFDENPEESVFWDKENKQVKYQICDGCEIDQALACWHADLLGIHDLFFAEHRISALKSIYKYNFLSMRKHNNPCRVFALDDEKATVMTSFPRGKTMIPILYSEECMTGFEYAVAENMLQCSMEKEALELTNAIDERYDGLKRNPFAEIECGTSYVRAMACYGFLPVYSGFKFNLPENELGFIPLKNGRYFWSVQDAWGTVDLSDKKATFKVLYGSIKLKSFVTCIKNVKEVSLEKDKILFNQQDDKLIFNEAVNIGKNKTLIIKS